MPHPDEARAKLTQAGLNLIQQALSIYDSDLKLAVCNRPFKEIFDLPEALVTPGVDFAETIRYMVERGEYGPTDDPEAAVQARVKAARAFEPHYMERIRPDGRWVSIEGSPLPQGGWVTVYTDITEIKRQEELLRLRSEELSDQLLAHTERLAQANRELAVTNAALEEAKRELTEMEARIRLTTEMMPAHIAHVDRSLHYTYSNRRLSSVLPGTPPDIVGLTGVEAMGAETFSRIEPYLRRALEGEASVFEFSHDASGRRIRSVFTPDTGEDGTVNGVYILSIDVTEETQARAALAQTHKRELAAQLTSGLAHDFGNLLTIILGLQSRLQRLPGLPGAARDMVAATITAARRGGTLLDRIARISGPRVLHPAPTDLPALLGELQVLANPSLPETTRLHIETQQIPPLLLLDAGSLQDSLLNLILNARDAIGAAGGEIRLSAQPLLDTWLEIIVSDTGPGFSEEALKHGLAPFFTTKGGAGSGLGLSMVYDQTQLSGGTVRLANRVEGGGMVTLRLPLRVVREPAAPRLVLLVEDIEEIRETVREMLRGLGHSVIEAASAEEALSLADLPGIGLILSDISLPGTMNGVDLAEALAARPHPAPLCLMTSLPAQSPLYQRAAQAGFTVLGKPVSEADLIALLTREEAA